MADSKEGKLTEGFRGAPIKKVMQPDMGKGFQGGKLPTNPPKPPPAKPK